MIGRLTLAALGGLLLGAAGMGMARDYLEPKHTSLADCIISQMRGLPQNDLSNLAVAKLCREEFPTGTLAIDTPKQKTFADLHGYDPNWCRKGEPEPEGGWLIACNPPPPNDLVDPAAQ
jgi:hypothetical protein